MTHRSYTGEATLRLGVEIWKYAANSIRLTRMRTIHVSVCLALTLASFVQAQSGIT